MSAISNRYAHPLMMGCRRIKSSAHQIVIKTQVVAKAIFAWIGYCATFFLRYVGAKTWSIPGVIMRTPYILFKRILGVPSNGRTIGQEIFNSGGQTTPQLLTKAEARAHLKRMTMAAFAHSSNSDEWIKPFGYNPIDTRTLGMQSPGLQAKEMCLFNPQSGLKIVLAEKGNEIVIAFGAIGSDQSETPNINRSHEKMFRNQNIKAVGNLLGADIGLFTEADQVLSQLRQSSRFQGKNIILAGQCLGGTLAQFLSLKYQIPSYCYNTLQLGAGLQWQLGSKALSNAERYVTHVYVQGDFLNNYKGQGIVDMLMNRIGVRTPGNFGKSYYIPAAYTKPSDIHNYCIGSLLKYIGQNDRAKPASLPPELLQ